MHEPNIGEIIRKVGSQRRLGQLIGVGQTTVTYWVKRYGVIPAEYAVVLEKNSGGEFPRWVTRPDLWEPPTHSQTTPEDIAQEYS